LISTAPLVPHRQVAGALADFAATVIRVAYGPGFATPPVDDGTFTADLGETAVRYLLARPDRPARVIGALGL
jgi:hypothetical protein